MGYVNRNAYGMAEPPPVQKLRIGISLIGEAVATVHPVGVRDFVRGGTGQSEKENARGEESGVVGEGIPHGSISRRSVRWTSFAHDPPNHLGWRCAMGNSGSTRNVIEWMVKRSESNGHGPDLAYFSSVENLKLRFKMRSEHGEWARIRSQARIQPSGLPNRSVFLWKRPINSIILWIGPVYGCRYVWE
jgi:hypothetical protein